MHVIAFSNESRINDLEMCCNMPMFIGFLLFFFLGLAVFRMEVTMIRQDYILNTRTWVVT